MHHGYIERFLMKLLADKSIPPSLINLAQFVYSRPQDYINAGKYSADVFADVEVYCMFVGYPRSGHSLVAQLLDAHPNIIIANEMDVLDYVKRGFSQTQIFSLILNNSRTWVQRGSRGKRYSYSVPGQWQGKFQSLKCIGDKKGGKSALRLAHKPSLLEKLKVAIAKEVKLIHVVRNPYDNIATLTLRKRSGLLPETIDYYFSCVDGVIKARNSIPNSDFITIRHESFVRDPHGTLELLCTYLDQEAPSDYLDVCSKIVSKSIHKSRYKIDWDDNSKQLVNKEILKRNCDFLEGYTFIK